LNTIPGLGKSGMSRIKARSSSLIDTSRDGRLT
jgi:hypothetical protein